jgi:hypothetical protein
MDGEKQQKQAECIGAVRRISQKKDMVDRYCDSEMFNFG